MLAEHLAGQSSWRAKKLYTKKLFNLPAPNIEDIKKEAEKQNHQKMLNRYPSVPNLEKRGTNSFKPKDFDSIANEQKRMEKLMTDLRKRPSLPNNYKSKKEDGVSPLERLRQQNNKRLYSKYHIETPQDNSNIFTLRSIQNTLLGNSKSSTNTKKLSDAILP